MIERSPDEDGTGNGISSEMLPDDGPGSFRALSPGALAFGAVLGFIIALIRPRSWR